MIKHSLIKDVVNTNDKKIKVVILQYHNTSSR